MANSSPKNQKNIALPADFSARLRQLREARHLSKTDLADAASTTYRTVQNLETNRHKRAQEKTLMGLAEALGLSYVDLMQSDPAAPENGAAKSRRRRAPWILAILLLVLAGAAWSAWDFATNRATWTLEQEDLRAYDGVFGIELWSLHRESRIAFCRAAPWDETVLLVGLSNFAADGGRVLALERATGRQIWEMTPDIPQLNRALGEDIVSAAIMGCASLDFLDVEGDGQLEMVVRFQHGLYHPNALCLVRRDGTLLKQYANKGHLSGLIAADIDADGKDEVVAAGVNNAPAYNGATLIVLDDEHWRGASIDSLGNPWSSEPDSSLIRVVIPAFPTEFQSQLRDQRLMAHTLRPVPQADGRIHLRVDVRGNFDPHQAVAVHFDDQLRITSGVAHDSFCQAIAADWPDSLKNRPGPCDPEWLVEWLGRASYFGAGW